MEFFAGLLVLLLLGLTIAGHTVKKSKENETYNKELQKQIDFKQKQLEELKTQVENAKRDTRVYMNQATVKALDIYEQSNIKIPVDIIEDIVSLNITDEKQAYEYIENQRHFWKLENTKKPYRR